MRRTPHLVLSMMTGSENTAMMNSSAGLAKPADGLARFSTMPSTGHMTTMNRAVTPKGSAEVTHRGDQGQQQAERLDALGGQGLRAGNKTGNDDADECDSDADQALRHGNVGIFHSPLTSLLSLSLQTVTQCKPRNYLLTSL